MAKSKPTPNFYKIFQLAEEHSEASLLLGQNPEGGEEKWTAPRLLVDSFAVELYLKCFFVLDKNAAPPYEHDLKKLFDALNPDTQSQIRETFRQIVESSPVLSNLSEFNPKMLHITDFDRSLTAAKNTFDGKRYRYEANSSGEWFYANLLLKAVRKFANMIVPLAEAARNQQNTT